MSCRKRIKWHFRDAKVVCPQESPFLPVCAFHGLYGCNDDDDDDDDDDDNDNNNNNNYNNNNKLLFILLHTLDVPMGKWTAI